MSKYFKYEDVYALVTSIILFNYDRETIKEEFDKMPTIDIVECEECRWRDVCSQVVSDIGCEVDTLLRWCSDGERINNE